MYERSLQSDLNAVLDAHAVAGLLGPRQVGKTTLALALGEQRPSIYLDLQAPSDRAKLDAPELYLRQHADRLVILDEIHHAPEIFAVLRGLVDEGRRAGRRTGRFLVLGSASPELLRQSSETLAGRILYLELAPLDAREVCGGGGEIDALWLRGGFPESFLASSEVVSLQWRQAFIRTYLERDIPQFGPRIPSETLRRFWTMLAHGQGGTLNASRLAAALGVSGRTVGRYVDLLTDLLLVRRLAPWTANVGKRVVRSPKVYVRDSGLAHALLGIGDLESLLAHPIAGMSWEGCVIESLLGSAPMGTEAYYYRTSVGAEIDLLLLLPDGSRAAFEIKRSLDPRPQRGFYTACEDVAATSRTVVYPGEESYPIRDGVQVHPLLAACDALTRQGRLS